MRRLDVAVQDSFRMGSAEGVRNLNGQIQQFVRFERSAAQPFLQRYALQGFHHDEGLALVFVDVVNRADVRMVQRRSRLCLATEPRQGVRVLLREILWQELERDGARRRVSSAL
jgi:hypothetical protein